MKLVWCPPGVVAMENAERGTATAGGKENAQNGDEADPKDEPAPQPRTTTATTPVKVFLTQGYWLGKYEVTQSEWKQVMKTEPWMGQKFTKEGNEPGPDFGNVRQRPPDGTSLGALGNTIPSPAR